jgi:HD-GYP domain-containing protein (c-di-GMP phosphodiesterase class II)
VRRLFRTDAAEFFAFSSIEQAAAAATRDALTTLAWLAAGAIGLAGLASFWLARTLTRPIDRLTGAIVAMRRDPTRRTAVEATGSSRELDALAATFNDLIGSLAAAQEETRAAYVGAIRALAAALDARDPYTAGHSERVSAISVAIGRVMSLPEEQLEVLRLGALLHDIGKIGITDAVLRKPGRLTTAEYETIKGHPALGARILGLVPFLGPHLPIVELHHECPDGSGYPHGLRGDQIPMLPRIVHVADAFDAMTSARAYRAARAPRAAVAELWRWSGSQFDAEVVTALVRARPGITPAWPADDEQGGPASADECAAVDAMPSGRLAEAALR